MTSRKRRRVRPDCAGRLQATHPTQAWALDFQFDETTDGRRLKLLNVVDEHTREALAMDVGRRADADTVVAVLDRLAGQRGAPKHLRMDNGPELIAWALRDRCRLGGTSTVSVEPGSPWEHPYVESFNGRVRDELLNLEEFGSLAEAQVLAEAWRTEYDTYRPHSALDGLTPAEYAQRWPANNSQHPHSSWTDNRGPVIAVSVTHNGVWGERQDRMLVPHDDWMRRSVKETARGYGLAMLCAWLLGTIGRSLGDIVEAIPYVIVWGGLGLLILAGVLN
ncbi:MAG TPA: integrase core domain-containing protein, partial [Actinomycetes bacterium]|nr:integrase core domain-containing protein [Actinomycetes bacterium]